MAPLLPMSINDIPPTWVPGISGAGSIGPFQEYRHESGLTVYFFIPLGEVVVYRPEPCPEWHRKIMDSLKEGEPFSLGEKSGGNFVGGVAIFLQWTEWMEEAYK